MNRHAANGRRAITIVAAVILAGCAVTDHSPAPTATSTTPMNMNPTASPAGTPIATVTAPRPTTTPTPAVLAGPWLGGPRTPGVQFLDVAWTGTRFIATTQSDGGTLSFQQSVDGISWQVVPGVGPSWARGGIAAGPGGMVAVGRIGDTPASWLSTDQLTWAPAPGSFAVSGLGTDEIEVTDVVAGPAGWLAVGRRDPACYIDCMLDPSRAYVWSSADGSHWTRIADQAAFKGGGMAAVAWTGDQLVAVGVAASRAAIWTSRDGTVWSRVPDAKMFHGPTTFGPALPASATDVAIHDGTIVAVGGVLGQDSSGVRTWWSRDGRTWSAGVMGPSDDGQLWSVIATPDGFLATGWSSGCRGGIWSSPDGLTWQCEASDAMFTGFAPNAAAVSDDIEVVVGFTDLDEESPNGPPGATWTRRIR